MKMNTFYIKILILIASLLGLSGVIYMEAPRINELSKILYKDNVSGLALIIAFLPMYIYIENRDMGKIAIYALGVILLLSYVNTIRLSIEEAKSSIVILVNTKKQELKEKKSELESLKEPSCFYPRQKNFEDPESYDLALKQYSYCSANLSKKSEKFEASKSEIEAQIKAIDSSIRTLENSDPDYSIPIMQGLSAFALSIILSIASSRACIKVAKIGKELYDEALYQAELSEDNRIKIAYLQNPEMSIRDLAKVLRMPKSTLSRKIKTLVPQWDSVGQERDKMGQRGTAVGQTENKGNSEKFGQLALFTGGY